MNKQEKFIAVLPGLCLAGWLWYSVSEQKKAAEAARAATASGDTVEATVVTRQMRRHGA